MSENNIKNITFQRNLVCISESELKRLIDHATELAEKVDKFESQERNSDVVVLQATLEQKRKDATVALKDFQEYNLRMTQKVKQLESDLAHERQKVGLMVKTINSSEKEVQALKSRLEYLEAQHKRDIISQNEVIRDRDTAEDNVKNLKSVVERFTAWVGSLSSEKYSEITNDAAVCLSKIK